MLDPPTQAPARRVARRPGRLLAFAAFVLAVLLPGLSRAGNPDERWRTIETEHFFVHYHALEQEAAERVAATAERAYDTLAVAWQHDVFLKVHITLSDNQDTANGFANAVPFPQVTAYATAPEALSVLESYDDWIDILITHELVHVFHLDTVHGIPRAVNAVFGFGVLGKVMSPNLVQPRWVIEGVATADESGFSGAGRRRSAQFDAYIRMAVLEGTFQSIDQVTSGARIFPHGTSVYLYGLHFMHYIAARYGREKLAELSHLYGGRLVPFGINRAIKDVLGVDFDRLWAEFQRDTERRFQAQARRIRSRGLRQGVRMTYSGQSTRYPMWSPDDGYVYFFKADSHREEGLKRIPATGGRVREGLGIGRQGTDVDIEHVVDVEDAGESSFVGASQDIVFGQSAVYDFRYRWSDLYRWNGGDPKGYERLTHGLRASEPHVAPDGRTAVFRRNDVAQSRLGFLDLQSGDVVEVPPLGRIDQVYTPRFAPDGQRVAFSGWREGGYRDIYVYDRRDQSTTRITADRHMDISPSWSPDGRYIVFVSDRDDVFNVYAWDTEARRLHQVSNVLGGAFEPMVSHDGTRLAYVGFTHEGFDLWMMDFDPDAWLAAMPPVDSMPLVDEGKPPTTSTGDRPPSFASRRYQPFRTFFPRVINPAALDLATLASGDAGALLGFSTAIQDVLGWHSLGVAFSYLTEPRIGVASVGYSYRRLFPNFNLNFSRGYVERGSGFERYLFDRPPTVTDRYVVSGYRERSTALSGGFSLPVVRHPRHNADVSADYTWVRYENLDAGQAPIDPNAPATRPPEVGDLAAVTLAASYSSTGDGGGTFTYGTETGRAARIGLSILDERLGGDFGDLQATAAYTEVIPMPWRGHQSLVLSARGGASAGGLSRRGGFCTSNFVQGIDLVQSLLLRAATGTLGGCGAIRGYSPLRVSSSGRYLAIGSAEYRVPIVDVDRGVGSAPFFLQRVAMVPFVDWGYAWTDRARIRDTLVGAGGALVIALRLGYSEPVSLMISYEHGFDDDNGVDLFRAVVATSF